MHMLMHVNIWFRFVWLIWLTGPAWELCMLGKTHQSRWWFTGCVLFSLGKNKSLKPKNLSFKGVFHIECRYLPGSGRPKILYLATVPAAMPGHFISPEDLKGKSHSKLWLAVHLRKKSLNASTNQVSVSELLIWHQPLKSNTALTNPGGLLCISEADISWSIPAPVSFGSPSDTSRTFRSQGVII